MNFVQVDKDNDQDICSKKEISNTVKNITYQDVSYSNLWSNKPKIFYPFAFSSLLFLIAGLFAIYSGLKFIRLIVYKEQKMIEEDNDDNLWKKVLKY